MAPRLHGRATEAAKCWELLATHGPAGWLPRSLPKLEKGLVLGWSGSWGPCRKEGNLKALQLGAGVQHPCPQGSLPEHQVDCQLCLAQGVCLAPHQKPLRTDLYVRHRRLWQAPPCTDGAVLCSIS